MKKLLTIVSLFVVIQVSAQTGYVPPQIYLRNQSDSSIIVSIGRLRVTDTLKPGQISKAHVGILIYEQLEGFCVKYPNSKMWLQCTVGPKQFSQLRKPGSYVIDFYYSKSKKIWAQDTNPL